MFYVCVVHSYTKFFNIMVDKSQNVRGEISALEVGSFADFPIGRYEYVLSCRSKLSKTTGKKFSSATVINTKLINGTNVDVIEVRITRIK